MVMSRWDPFGEALTLRDAMNRLFEQAVLQPEGQSGARGGAMAPPLDVVETPDEFVVKASLPGVKPDDVNIQLHQGVLTISGEFNEESPSSQGAAAQGQAQPAQGAQGQGQQGGQRHHYHIRERRHGRFFRSITLPAQIDPNRAQASFEHGVLTLTIPKAEETKPRRIQINTGGAQQSQPTIEGTASHGGSRASRSASGAASSSSSGGAAAQHSSSSGETGSSSG